METVANTLSDQLESMDKEALITLAKETYNLDIDRRLSEMSIRKELLHQDTEIKRQARAMTEQSANSVATDSDPLVTIVFMPLDFPNAPLDFSYDSGRGVVGASATPNEREKAIKRGALPTLPRYQLFPGQTYELPMSVVKHLKSKTFRDSQPIIDTQTGMIAGNKPIIKPRFSADIQLTDDQYRKVGKPNTL